MEVKRILDENVEYCSICGERIYNFSEWYLDEPLCKSCWFAEKDKEIGD